MKPGKKKEKQGTMKRETKYRYWDSFNAKMQYCDTGYIDYLSKFFIEYDAALEGENNPILMQFTELLDKNGKEIYEGDVVKRSTLNHEWDDDNSNVPKYIEQVSFVEYRSNGFWVNAEDFGWEGENLWTWNLMEVIGNIYEHPSLLQSTPKQEQ